MQQGNQYENYGYDPYEQPPSRGLTEKIFGARTAQRLKSPAAAAVIVLVAGAAFAGVIAGTYSGGSSGEEAVPVIRAQADRFKTEPADRGGMDVPHRESTVFNTVRGQPFNGSAPVENLLAANEEPEPIDKLQAFERIAAEEMREGEVTAPDEAELEPSAGAAEPEKPASAGGEGIISGEPENKDSGTLAEAKQAVDQAVEKAQEKTAALTAQEQEQAEKEADTELLTKIVKREVTEEKIAPKELAQPTTAASTAKPPSTLHTPGASPDTIAFVRDVLDKKDSKAVEQRAAAAAPAPAPAPVPTAAQAEKAASVTPAAGDASSFRTESSGSYFVQVASVPSRDLTASEWSKLTKKFSSLSGLEYRVEEANLGERGTFYRIQAGPFSKEQAGALCDSIKAQKSDGCLVVR